MHVVRYIQINILQEHTYYIIRTAEVCMCVRMRSLVAWC